MTTRAELPQDLLCRIAKRIDSIEDFVAFGAVCAMWRHVTLRKDAMESLQSPRLHLAKERKQSKQLTLGDCLFSVSNLRMVGNGEDWVLAFYSPIRDKIYRMPLKNNSQTKEIGTKGWLAIVSQGRELSLFHPFSGTVIPVPC